MLWRSEKSIQEPKRWAQEDTFTILHTNHIATVFRLFKTSVKRRELKVNDRTNDFTIRMMILRMTETI